MPDQKLIDYIKESKEKGFSDDQIRKALLDVGWEEKDIETAFKSILEPARPTSAISKLPDPVALLENAWNIYKQRVWVFAGILLIPIVLSLLEYILGSLFLNRLTLDIGAWKVFSIIIADLLLLLAIFLISLWGQVSLLYAIKDSEEKINIIEAYKRGKSKIFSYWWISILTGIIIAAGILLLIIPGIIFAVWFAFALFILVVEGLKGTKALRKSKEYVRGRWWSVFIRIVAGSIMIGTLPASIVVFSTLPFQLNWVDIAWLETTIQAIVGSVFALFVFPLIITYDFLIYKTLKGELFLAPAKKKTTTFVIITVIVGLLLILGSIGLTVASRLKEVRGRANDAVIKTALSEARIAAEAYYDANGSYSGICTTDRDFARIRDEIVNNGGSWTCNDRADAYCLESSLSSGYYCIDSTGTSKANTTAGCAADSIICPSDPQAIARDNQRVEDLKKIADALDAYYRDHSSYPVMEMCLEVHSLGFPTYLKNGSIKWDSLESILQSGGYAGSLPEDPKKDPTSDYIYMYNSENGTTYTLSALLEGRNDALNSDFDGRMGRCSFCDDPTYCIRSPR